MRRAPASTRTPSPAGRAVAIGEVKAVNDRQLLMIEGGDNLGDNLAAPRFKKVFLLDLASGGRARRLRRQRCSSTCSRIPDPSGVAGDGDFFRLPFYTIESVHVVDERTLLVASDKTSRFPTGARASRSADRTGPLAA